MNRSTALTGLILSAALHAGLLLTVDPPADRPVIRAPLEISLRPVRVSETETPAATEVPAQRTEEADNATERQTKAQEPPAPSSLIPSRSPAASQAVPSPEKTGPEISSPRAEPPPPPPSDPAPVRRPPEVTPTPAIAPDRAEVKAEPSKPTLKAMESETELEAKTEQSLPTAATQMQNRQGEITPPVYIPTARPYPPTARERGWEGTVQLQVEIARDGRVTAVELHESSGYPLLDRAAIRQFRNARFRPALRDGVPIAFTARLPVVFELK